MKKRIMLDMDDCFTDTIIMDLISEFLGRDVSSSESEGYFLQDLLGDKKDEFFSKYKEYNFYDGSVLYKDAKRVIEKLNEKYELYICTAYIWKEIPECGGFNLKNKYEWLLKELPFVKPEQYIFTNNKVIINTDIRIDDKPSNLDNAATKILFTAYHNKDLTNDYLKNNNIKRADSWKDIEDILL